MEQRILLIIKRLSGNYLAIRARKNDQITYQTARWGRVPGQWLAPAFTQVLRAPWFQCHAHAFTVCPFRNWAHSA